MGPQNLLDERAARTDHADDKDRHRRGVAEASSFANHRGGEDPTHAVEPLQHCRLVINDLPPLERIAVEQMAERTLMLPDVRVTLAEREIELDLLFVGERCSIVDQRLKRREVPVAEGDVPATEQIDIEPGPPRR